MKALVLHPEFQLYERKDKAFCSSLQVAQEFGKRHDNVLADIMSLMRNEQHVLKLFLTSLPIILRVPRTPIPRTRNNPCIS